MRPTPALPCALAALCSPLAADVISCGPNIQNAICLSGPVFDGQDGPLTPGQVYVLFDVNVPDGASLTADGAILKLPHNGSLTVSGSLSANGTVITSLHDDQAGGDTNKNGNATLPAPGDWGLVRLLDGADASVLAGTEIAYATIGVVLASADATLDGVVVRDVVGDGVDLSSNSLATVSGCSFERCGGYALTGVPLRALPGFLGNSAADCALGTALVATEGSVPANLAIDPANALNGDGVFQLCTTGTTVAVGATLTLRPGVILKFGGSGCSQVQNLFIDGVLDATAVTLTSIHDDTAGGDTNKNGAATLPAPGDWGFCRFDPDSDASRLANVRVSYGGGAIVPGPVLSLVSSDLELDGVLVSDCKGAALDLNGGSFPTVTGCTFRDNLGQAVEGVRIHALPGFSDNSASGNGGGDAMILDVTSDHVLSDLALDLDSTFGASGTLVLDTYLTVDSGTTLTVPAGMVVKACIGREIEAQGTFVLDGTGAGQIVLTSVRDTSFGGDTGTYGPGGAPQPGDWDGLIFQVGSSASSVRNARLRYTGGASVSAALDLRFGASPTVQDVVVELGAKAALDLRTSATPVVRDCDFISNAAAILGTPITALGAFSGNEATGNAAGDVLVIADGDVPAGPFPGGASVPVAASFGGTGVFRVTAPIDVPEGARLSIDGGVVLKWDHPGGITVDGTLTAGSSGSPTVLTRIEDDTIGGDTNGDGGATTPDPGDWQGLAFSDDSGASVLDDVEVRYAGRLGASIDLSATTVAMSDVVVRNGKGTALDLSSNSVPSVTDCSFLDCERAVDGVPIVAVPGFVGNSASGNTLGDFLRITNGNVSSDLLIGPKNSLDQAPFVVAANVVVPAGRTLRLEGGTQIKWQGAVGVTVDGTLVTLGSGFVPVFLTSIHDDQIGGDTNENGNATSPAPGDWINLRLNDGADASVLAGLVVRYAGRNLASSIDLVSADPIVVDSRVRHGLGDGMELSGNSFPQVRRSSFDDCGLIAVDEVPLAAIQRFEDCRAAGNGVYDAIRVTSTTFSGEAEIEQRNSLNAGGLFVVDTDVTIDAGERLTVRQGVVLKLVGFRSLVANGRLDLEGTGFQPVVLTSVRDDGVLGDSNKDGAATVPAPGDWQGVRWFAAGTPSSARHAVLRFASSPALQTTSNGSGLALSSVRVEDSAGDAFRLAGLAGDAANLVALRAGGDGIELTGGAFDVLFATVTASAQVGIRANPNHAGVVSSSVSFANAGAPIEGFVAGEVFFSDVGPLFAGADGNIDADPLFVAPAGGDLRLDAGSPCLNAGELARALRARKDWEERSRALDHDLSGAMLPDMGAYERSAYELVVAGDPLPDEVISLTVVGPPGAATFEAGRGEGFEVLDPLGFLTTGTPRATVAVVPVGTPLLLRVPRGGSGAGMFLQATARSSADPTLGNVTQLFRFRFARPDPTPPSTK